MSARKGCLVTLVVLVLLAVAVWFVGMPLLNRKAGSIVESTIEEMVRSSGLEGLRYDGVRIDAARGSVQIDGLSVPLEGATVKAGRVVLTVDPAELAAFGLGRSEGLSAAQLEVDRLSFSDAALALDLGTATITLGGLIDLNAPERSTARDVALVATDASFADKESGLGLDAKNLDVKVQGTLSTMTLEKDFDGILDDIAYIDVDAKQGAIVPDERVMAQLGLFAVASPWIADTRNWSFESVQLQARSLEKALAFDSFALAAPLMDAKGTASIPRKDGKDISLDLDVRQLNSQVRDELNPLLGMLGQTIPSGSFGLTFDWQGVGIPEMVFR